MNAPAGSAPPVPPVPASPTPAIPLLALRDVTKYFGGVRAVDHFSLDVYAGEIAGIIGPNGSGKTTLFNLITGLYSFTGSISFDGARIDGLPPHQVLRRRIARTFQNIRLFDGMLVIENLLVGMHTRLQSSLWSACFKTAKFLDEERRAVDEARDILRFFPELAGTETEIARHLSYANQRRVEILRGLAARPKLLLLDEPAAGMNTSEARKLLSDIRRLRDLGITILLIEHNMSVMSGVTDRVVAMDQGEKVAEGQFEDVSRHPRVLAAYLGTEH